MSRPPVRFAVVGAKGYSLAHLDAVRMLAEKGRARLTASTIVDRADHPDLVAELEAAGVSILDAYQAMLDRCHDMVDIVTLPVPIYLHAPMAIAALEAGYHVLLEKPVAGVLADADWILAARRASDKQCAVGFQQIYSPLFQTLKRYVVEGRLGEVKRIRMMALWPRDPAYYGRNEWAGKLYCRGKPVFDSPFNNALAHQIMNMLYLASPAPRQAAYPARTEAELFRAYNIPSFDTGCMRVLTEGGVELVFAASHACDITVHPTLKLEASRATVEHVYGGDATVTYADGAVEVIEQQDPSMHEFDNLVDLVTGVVQEPLCTLEMARAQLACVHAVHRAASIVSVPPQWVTELESGQRVIAGIGEAVAGCFDSGRLFSELDAPFARREEENHAHSG